MFQTIKRLFFIILLFTLSSAVQAHFQMIIPSDDMVTQQESRHLNIEIKFWHPYEGLGMHMDLPAQFGVLNNGKKTNLIKQLTPSKLTDRNKNKFSGYLSTYSIKRPGDHVFYLQPKPYWEPSEESFIVHYTKVIVNTFGMELGWDEELGLKTEIIPLTRPYGLYAGNIFQGIVKVNGKIVPFSEVEVEYYNQDGKLKPQADPMITQVIRADVNGVFTYAMPKSGWWLFAALNEDSEKMKHNDKEYPVEIGAVLLVKTHDMH